jgi:glycosyltransferase involved in cell wall biosynthesis
MKNISIIIALYNEIRFINRTLESVIGEADEIILSDNASTDGTSDICQQYASKYPEIKYTRQKEMISMSENHFFSMSQATGKYIRGMGGHDMISKGSSQSMFDLLEKYKDATMAFHKYTINLNPDYSFKSFHCHNEFKNDLTFDSPFLRVKSMIKNICDFSIGYGFFRADLFKHIVSKKCIFQDVGITDHTILAEFARDGKILIDDNSIFFRMNPHDKNESLFEQGERINKNIYPNRYFHPLSWTFAFISEQYYLATEMQTLPDAPVNFSREILNILLEKYWGSNIIPHLNEMLPVVSGKEIFCNELLRSISEYQKKRQDKIKTGKLKKIILIIKKIIKNVLPYCVVNLYKRYHN